MKHLSVFCMFVVDWRCSGTSLSIRRWRKGCYNSSRKFLFSITKNIRRCICVPDACGANIWNITYYVCVCCVAWLLLLLSLKNISLPIFRIVQSTTFRVISSFKSGKYCVKCLANLFICHFCGSVIGENISQNWNFQDLEKKKTK